MTGDGDGAARRAPFELTVHRSDNGSARLRVAGELDVSTALRLHAGLAELIAHGSGDVHLNMAGVRFCAAAGITELLHARQSLASQARRLILTEVPDQVARAIHLAEADTLLDN